MATDIKPQAQAFADSYVSAVKTCADSPTATIEDAAQAIASHYHPTEFTAFSWGAISKLASSSSDATTKVKAYLEEWVKSGIGLKYYHVTTRVEVVSPSSALCWMTWGINPENDVKSWEWENVYAFRLPPGSEKGHWEFCISDNEAAEAIKRMPEIFNRMQ